MLFSGKWSVIQSMKGIRNSFVLARYQTWDFSVTVTAATSR
jgi:hypothetical protein